MEKKNVVHTEKVIKKNKAFFLDLKEAENGSDYLVINQTRTNAEGERERVKMILFEEDLERFSQAFVKVLFYFNNRATQSKREAYQAKVREDFPNAYQLWTKEDEDLLKELYRQGHGVEELMVHFKRNKGGIEKRLEILGLSAKSPAA